MRTRTIAAGLGLALLGLATPPAHATGGESTYRGDCGFTTLNDMSPGGQLGGQDTWTGSYDAEIVLYSPTHNNVVNATVTCVLRVNGVTQATFAPHSGSGVVAFAGPLTFTAGITDIVTLCTIVDYTSDPTPTSDRCPDLTTQQVIPQWEIDLIDWVVAWVAYPLAYVDPATCPVLGAAAPGAGPVVIQPDGDVYIGGSAPEDLWYDCAPYEDGSPPPPDPEQPPLIPPYPPLDTNGPTGGGWNDGDTGFLTLVSPEATTVYPAPDPAAAHDVASTCAFRTDRAAGTIKVVGDTVAGRQPVADSVRIRCRLQDATTGAVLYDHTETATGPAAVLHDTIAATTGKVTVCTEGTGVWGTRTVTVGPYCRPGTAI